MNAAVQLFPAPTCSTLPSLKIKYAEHELVSHLRVGNREGIKALVEMYSTSLYGIILRIVKVEEIAEDVLQDTFIKVWKSFSLYDPAKGRLFTWLSNMARRIAIDQLRSSYSRNYTTTERIDPGQVKLEIVDYSSSNTDHIGIKTLTSSLKMEYKCIIDLVYFQGYTHVEAAEYLHIPVGTLKTRLRMAIRSLRTQFN